ncbi:MAG TPA: CHAT domain-containing protein, partial [Niastella sp.]|nr:CHAT domain-containing protein [Niastella sp.]
STIINYNATEQAVFETFLSKADIRLFHFSGHAGSGKILMDDGELSHGNIIAAMIRYAKHLKLVFLNGCATHDLVDKFLEYGASVVIATKAPVYDKIACDFSAYFYEALCARKLSIGQSFDYAKQKIKEGIKAKLQENFPPQQPTESNEAYDKRIEETGEYNKAIEAFDKAETARTIVKPGKERTGVFEWAIYHNEEVSPAQREANESWQVVDETNPTLIDHVEPSFDFLSSLGQAVIDLKADLPQTDPHFGIFTEIASQHKQALSWNAAGTNHLIDYLYNLLLSPHASPVRDMINYSKDNRAQLEYPVSTNKTMLFNLLTYQVDLYQKFIRTAIEIMMSDFMETVIMVSQSGREDLAQLFNQALHSNNLAAPLKQLIDGQKNLNDIRFDIDMMRNIVTFLTEGRSKLPNEDRKSFRQFVGEYNGNNYVSGIDVALSNSIHEVAVAIINKYTAKTIEQSSLETLQ